MMIRGRVLASLAALALLTVGHSARAGFENFKGGLPITFGGAIMADTGNISTADSLTLPALYYFAGVGSGDFSTYLDPISTPTTQLSSSSTISGLNPTLLPSAGYTQFNTGGGFTFGNSAFGNFVASAYEAVATSAGSQSYTFYGTFTTGTDFANDPNKGSGGATVTFRFTQSGAGNPISASATLSVPATSMPAVPEPASISLLGLGLLGVGSRVLLRRRRPA